MKKTEGQKVVRTEKRRHLSPGKERGGPHKGGVVDIGKKAKG